MDNLCLCGRQADRLHCPHCGCATVYGLASKTDIVTRDSGEVIKLRVYRCRKCSAVFNDDEWRFRCTAPPPLLGHRAEKTKTMSDVLTEEAITSAQSATEGIVITSLTGEDRIEAIRKLMQATMGDNK